MYQKYFKDFQLNYVLNSHYLAVILFLFFFLKCDIVEIDGVMDWHHAPHS